MDTLLLLAGRGAGLFGILLCALAGGARLAGHYALGSFQTITLLQGGIALTSGACFLLLWALSARR